MPTTVTSPVDTTLPPTPIASPRLAELVVHLTDCSPGLAVAAVAASTGGRVPRSADDRLAAVASAMIAVRRSIDLRDRPPAAT